MPFPYRTRKPSALLGTSQAICKTIEASAVDVLDNFDKRYSSSRNHFRSLEAIKARSLRRLGSSGAPASRSARIFRRAKRATGQLYAPSFNINRAWRIDLRTISSIKGSIARPLPLRRRQQPGIGRRKRGAVDVRRQPSRFGAARVTAFECGSRPCARLPPQFGTGSSLEPRNSRTSYRRSPHAGTRWL
jgi:hypothetical protein